MELHLWHASTARLGLSTARRKKKKGRREMDRDGEWSDKEQIRCLSIEETEAFGENRGVRRWGGRQWWQKGRERGSVFVNLMYLISFAVSESSRGWSNSGSKERAGEREESRLMQQNKGAVAPRRSQCLFLHPPLPPPSCARCHLSIFFLFYFNFSLMSF